jgi:predicted transcriptional regulator
MQWLNELDKTYQLTHPDYGIGDFIEELKSKGYIDEPTNNGEIKITSKTERSIRKKLLEEIFGNLKDQTR